MTDTVLMPREAEETGFILETWRHAALGAGITPRLLGAFGRRCGNHPEDLIEAYFTFLRLLGKSSRRRMAVGHPGCPGMTRDEVQVFALLAGAQAANWQLFDAHLCWLVPHSARGLVAASAITLATVLAAYGIEIFEARPDVPPQSAIPYRPALVRAAAH